MEGLRFQEKGKKNQGYMNKKVTTWEGFGVILPHISFQNLIPTRLNSTKEVNIKLF